MKLFTHALSPDLELRLLLPPHAEALLRTLAADRNHLRPWVSYAEQIQSLEDAGAFIDAGLRQFAAHDGFWVGLWHQEELIGLISHVRVNWETRTTALQYWLAERAQGRGHMTAACRFMVEQSLVNYGLERCEIRADVRNARSRAIPERLGFTFEGVLRRNDRIQGEFVDHAVYSMLRDEWTQTEGTLSSLLRTPPPAKSPFKLFGR